MNKKLAISNQPSAVWSVLKHTIKKPYGSYNQCQLCGGTWWDDERERHKFDCELPHAFDEWAEGYSKNAELATLRARVQAAQQEAYWQAVHDVQKFIVENYDKHTGDWIMTPAEQLNNAMDVWLIQNAALKAVQA